MLVAVAVVILALVGVSVLVCCTVFSCRACRKSAPESEEVHHYDSNDLYGIYTEVASHAIERDGVLHNPLGSRETEAYYTSIDDPTHPSVAVTTGRPHTLVHAERVEMMKNGAYWYIKKNLETSVEYI